MKIYVSQCWMLYGAVMIVGIWDNLDAAIECAQVALQEDDDYDQASVESYALNEPAPDQLHGRVEWESF